MLFSLLVAATWEYKMQKQSLTEALQTFDVLPAVSDKIIVDVNAAVAAEYVRLGMLMDRDHVWRWLKLTDSASSARTVADMAIRAGVSGGTSDALELAVFSADIGRLILDKKSRVLGVKQDQVEHGAASAEFIEEIAGDEANANPLWCAVVTAVRLHSWVNNPTLENAGGNEYTLRMTNILRDVDMADNWDNGWIYLTDDRMRQEMEQWKFSNIPFIPSEQTERFLESRPLIRADCQTYAGFMLQFLSWGFNFTYSELWQKVVETGNPGKVLRFIGNKLTEGGHHDVWRKIKRHARMTLDVTPVE